MYRILFAGDTDFCDRISPKTENLDFPKTNRSIALERQKTGKLASIRISRIAIQSAALVARRRSTGFAPPLQFDRLKLARDRAPLQPIGFRRDAEMPLKRVALLLIAGEARLADDVFDRRIGLAQQ